MSSDPEQDYFCDGITEEIINLLTHIAGLKVIAPSSAFQFNAHFSAIRPTIDIGLAKNYAFASMAIFVETACKDSPDLRYILRQVFW
jgi:hypothetical protein